jgi:hypothetical protein
VSNSFKVVLLSSAQLSHSIKHASVAGEMGILGAFRVVGPGSYRVKAGSLDGALRTKRTVGEMSSQGNRACAMAA